AALTALTERQWQRWARAHRLSEARTQELWAVLQRPQLPVPAHVVRAKGRLMQSLVAQLTLVVEVVGAYREAIEDFFARIPAAQWIRTLPIGDHGITAPTLWARQVPYDEQYHLAMMTRQQLRQRQKKVA